MDGYADQEGLLGRHGAAAVEEDQIRDMTKPLTKAEKAAKQKKDAKLNEMRPMHAKMVAKSNKRQSNYDKYAFGQEPPKEKKVEKPVKIVKQIDLTKALERAREEEQAALMKQVQPVEGRDERPIKPAELKASAQDHRALGSLPAVAADMTEPTPGPVIPALPSLAAE